MLALMEERKSIVFWLNNHVAGSMNDYEGGLLVLSSYMPEQLEKFKVLRNEKRLYDFFVERLSSLRKKTVVQKNTVPIKQVASPKVKAPIQTKIEQPKTLKTVQKSTESQPKAKENVIDELVAENKAIMKNQGAIHARMFWTGRSKEGKALPLTPEQKSLRAELLEELISNEKQLRINWNAMEHFRIYKQLPQGMTETTQKEQKEVAPPSDYHEREKNRKMIVYLKTKIKSANKRLQTLSGTKLDKEIAKVSKWSKELQNREKIHEAYGKSAK